MNNEISDYLVFREEELIKRANALKVNAGVEPGTDLGPVISKQVKAKNICFTALFSLVQLLPTYVFYI